MRVKDLSERARSRFIKDQIQKLKNSHPDPGEAGAEVLAELERMVAR
jgi:hypothetical protein